MADYLGVDIDERTLSRFHSKVNKNGPIPESRPELGPCWLWTPPGSAGGYGQFYFRGKQWLAHRASYTLHVSEIPAGLTIDHLCRIRSCVNPAHLDPVTLRENLARADVWKRGAERQKAATHCPSGHEYSLANVRIAPDGTRSCRACARRNSRNSRLRRLAKNPPQARPVRTECSNGHLVAEFGYVGSDGKQHCHECDRVRLRRYRAAKKATTPPKPVKTQCGKGHPWVEENIYVNPATGQKACRKCHNERTLASYHANKKPRTSKPDRTECAHGHPWVPENLKRVAKDRWACRLCANERNRQYERRKRSTIPPAA